MCWWHMATHWQLGVQVQEQTWVLKSQLAEAKFSAWALGAREPGKCWASITTQTALSSRRFQACLPGPLLQPSRAESSAKTPERPHLHLPRSASSRKTLRTAQALTSCDLELSPSIAPAGDTLPAIVTGRTAGQRSQKPCVTCSESPPHEALTENPIWCKSHIYID